MSFIGQTNFHHMKSFLLGLPFVAVFFITIWGKSDPVVCLESAEEFVIVRMDGQERRYDSENRIRVSRFVNEFGEASTKIRLIPNSSAFTHFVLDFPADRTGEFINGNIEFSFLDYDLERKYDKMSVRCSHKECPINFKVLVSEYGKQGEKVKGAFVGDYLFVDEPVHFEGEFEVIME